MFINTFKFFISYFNLFGILGSSIWAFIKRGGLAFPHCLEHIKDSLSLKCASWVPKLMGWGGGSPIFGHCPNLSCFFRDGFPYHPRVITQLDNCLSKRPSDQMTFIEMSIISTEETCNDILKIWRGPGLTSTPCITSSFLTTEITARGRMSNTETQSNLSGLPSRLSANQFFYFFLLFTRLHGETLNGGSVLGQV